MYENRIMAILNELQKTEIFDEDGLTPEQLAFLKAEAEKNENTPRYEWWNDEEMVAELDQIADDRESGKDPCVSWEEVKKQLTQELALLRNKARTNISD